MEIPYTICFCHVRQQVLMLHRAFPPNAHLWNGLGGKIEAGETPLSSVRREMREEAGIDLDDAPSLHFAGVVSWGLAGREPAKGMYAYVARLSPHQVERVQCADTAEGLLAWKPLAWVCDPANLAVVSNIPRFLPLLLANQTPREYCCEYGQENLSSQSFQRLMVRPLPPAVELRECRGW